MFLIGKLQFANGNSERSKQPANKNELDRIEITFLRVLYLNIPYLDTSYSYLVLIDQSRRVFTNYPQNQRITIVNPTTLQLANANSKCPKIMPKRIPLRHHLQLPSSDRSISKSSRELTPQAAYMNCRWKNEEAKYRIHLTFRDCLDTDQRAIETRGAN